jgi:hypothetical protein
MSDQTTTIPVDDDPMDAASNAKLAPRDVFGELVVDAWFCVLQKGVGAVPFDINQHNKDDRRTRIDIHIYPLADMKLKFTIERNLIAESRDWAGGTWPTLKTLGVKTLKEVNHKWVRVQQVPSGRTYRNAKGDEKEATMLKFLALYDTEQACREAYLSARPTTAPEPGIEDADTHPVGAPNTAPAQPPSDDKERKTAFEFVKVIVTTNKGNRAQIAAQLASMPMVSKFYTIDSPEVALLLTN